MRIMLIRLILNFVFFNQILAQDQMLEDLGIALSTNISKEVVRGMYTTLKLQLEGESFVLTEKAAAEKVLKTFFIIMKHYLLNILHLLRSPMDCFTEWVFIRHEPENNIEFIYYLKKKRVNTIYLPYPFQRIDNKDYF